MFSERLEQIRKKLNVTQEGLCTLLFGVPIRTLQSWLNGEKEPPKYVQELIFFKLERAIYECKQTGE